jgi:hypothetical protein
MSHPAALDLDQLLRDCDARRLRRSGPGGQHRNKVETAVVLTHRPTGIAAEANERRSPVENRRVALRRLRLKLALAVRSAADPASLAPSDLWRTRSRGGRLRVNPAHDDFPALLAEALDALAAADFDAPRAAAALEVSTSQLIGLLRREPAALTLLNAERAQRGLRPMK